MFSLSLRVPFLPCLRILRLYIVKVKWYLVHYLQNQNCKSQKTKKITKLKILYLLDCPSG